MAVAQFFVGDVRLKPLLQMLLELADFVHPMFERGFGFSAFCGNSSTYIGLLRPSSSNIFFLPSQVVSATTRSAQFKKGFLPVTW